MQQSSSRDTTEPRETNSSTAGGITGTVPAETLERVREQAASFRPTLPNEERRLLLEALTALALFNPLCLNEKHAFQYRTNTLNSMPQALVKEAFAAAQKLSEEYYNGR